MKKRIISLLFVFLLALGAMPSTVAIAATEEESVEGELINSYVPMLSDATGNAVDMACDAVEQLLNEYYRVSDISGKVVSMEKKNDGVNLVIRVSYSTEIRAKTPDEAPYIKGILAALESLTDAEEIQRATDYLTIWRGELARDHIGKTLYHNADFSVFIPFQISEGHSSIDSKSRLVMDESTIAVYSAIETDGTIAYCEEPLSDFIPSEQEVMESARNDVFSIVNGDVKTQLSKMRGTSSRAKELNRVAAATYAKDENNFPAGTKPDGKKYDNYSSDCANFVSQCYSAGGVVQDPAGGPQTTWYPYSGAWCFTGGPRGLQGHYGVCDYMLDMDIVFSAGKGVWTRAFAGSIMYYPKSLTDQAHIGIITSNDGQSAYYSAHTTDHCNIKLGSMKTSLSYYIPVWDSYTGIWTTQ